MSPIGDSHIVRNYDAELDRLRQMIGRMGGQAEAQLRSALEAMTERDSDAAALVVAGDHEIDDYDAQVNDLTVRLLALRAPVADDLRTVLTALKVSAELERIADLAANVAKRTLVMNQAAAVPASRAAIRMGWVVVDRIKRVLDAYLAYDAEAALDVWKGDHEVDDLYSSLFREILTYMMEDPRTITASTHLMFVAKNLERCGDHATNIAEMTCYLVSGRPLRQDRPKHDTSSITGEG
jgi:phosphate transport system protein